MMYECRGQITRVFDLLGEVAMVSFEKMANKCVGLNQSLKAVREGKAAEVYLAQDADEKIKTQVEILCRENGVEIQWITTMKELGQAAGITVGSAVVTVLKV